MPEESPRVRVQRHPGVQHVAGMLALDRDPDEPVADVDHGVVQAGQRLAQRRRGSVGFVRAHQNQPLVGAEPERLDAAARGAAQRAGQLPAEGGRCARAGLLVAAHDQLAAERQGGERHRRGTRNAALRPRQRRERARAGGLSHRAGSPGSKNTAW